MLGVIENGAEMIVHYDCRLKRLRKISQLARSVSRVRYGEWFRAYLID